MIGPRPRIRPILVRWLALAAAMVVLQCIGRGPLGAPPLRPPHHLVEWWEARGPVLATFAALRAVSWGLGCYLLVLWTAVLVARCTAARGLLPLVCRCRLPGARTAARAAFGMSAVGAAWLAGGGTSFAVDGGTGTTSTTLPAAAPVQAPEVAPVLRYAGPVQGPVLRDTGPPSATGAPGPPTTAGPAGPPTTAGPAPPAGRPSAAGPAPSARPADGRDRPGATPGAHDAEPAPPSPTVPSTPRRPGRAVVRLRPTLRPETATAPADRPGAEVWTVRTGDNLWSIAEARLARAWAFPPPEPVLGRYWSMVVRANRARLADPDLLFAGDRVVLPPPPPPPPVAPAPSRSPAG